MRFGIFSLEFSLNVSAFHIETYDAGKLSGNSTKRFPDIIEIRHRKDGEKRPIKKVVKLVNKMTSRNNSLMKIGA